MSFFPVNSIDLYFLKFETLWDCRSYSASGGLDVVPHRKL